jgi:glucose-1-phosphate cytidylyltransferase
MKVVLFCGGMGLRMREASETLPKPMVPLGTRPIIWHLMKYYAHHGHRDFIFCLGHRSQTFKDYFLNYNEFISNDFVITDGGRTVELLRRDMADWRLTFLETGIDANIGERLLHARPHLADEEMFLANYADGLTDCHLPTIVDLLRRRPDGVGAFMAARPSTSFHFVETDADGAVLGVRDVAEQDLWVNAGYFAFRNAIFDHIRPGEELVHQPFERLIAERRLVAHLHRGFWRGCDTFKDLQTLETLMARGCAPWEVWRAGGDAQRADGALAAAAARLAALDAPGAGP